MPTSLNALKLWKVYLAQNQFTLVTDHESLKYIKTQPNLSARQIRWLDLLQEYNFNVVYWPGEKNVVADALSRRPTEAINAFVEVKPDSALQGAIRVGYGKDRYFGPIYSHLKDPKRRKDPKIEARSKLFSLENNLLYFVVEGSHRLSVPKDKGIRLRLLQESHDGPLSGHLGFE